MNPSPRTGRLDNSIARLRVVTTLLFLLGGLASVSGCETIPRDRYGVNHIRFHGVEEMDEYALRACLATTQRRRRTLNLSRTLQPVCGEPPFESSTRVRIPLWRADWPLFDRSVFERDLRRIERWYRARGFYGAHVVSAQHSPPQAAIDDRVDDNSTCERQGEGEGCAIDIDITVVEGEPVVVRGITTSGDENLEADLQAELRGRSELIVGERFDEVLYERSKAGMVNTLHDATFACATVHGSVDVDLEDHAAIVAFAVDAGREHIIGDLTLEGELDLRRATILATADIDPGMPFTDALLAEARHAVYALGTFASVDVVGTPRRDENDACTGVVDVAIQVTPGRRFRYGVGGGLQAGVIGSGLEQQDVRQWDIHLLGFIEHRNFLGGLRRIRLEERPKLIFPDSFPRVESESGVGPRFGNELRFEFRQPAFIESRTTLLFTARWDYGLDPQDSFFRHSIDAAIGLRRTFLDGRISAALGIHYNLYLRDDADAQVVQSDYQVVFLEQQVQVDLRDNPANPRLGLYFGLDLQLSALLDWSYVRVSPDLRGYVPLGPLVLAARFRLGWMHIWNASADLDPISSRLGPQPYRLRSGGSSSHRGFVAGFLGDGNELVSSDPNGAEFLQNSGGLRRWEASLELRIPLNEDVGVVAFGDIGDVNRGDTFRFDYLHLALGLGMRYRTLIGPFRFDIAWLVPGAQVLGDESRLRTRHRANLFGWEFDGAIHLTIGEAF